MKRGFLGLLIAGLAALSAPATGAQRPAAAGNTAQAGVACLVGREPAAFTQLLRTPPYSVAERREAARLLPLFRRCRNEDETLSTSAAQLRAAAAEHLYGREFATAQAARTPPLAVAPLLRVDQARDRAEVEPLAATFTLFECLTAAHPDAVRAYLATVPASEAEQTAFRALSPGLVACLPSGGSRQLALGGAAMRGVLAEMLYRWSIVQRDGAASPFAAAPTPAR